MSFVSIDPSTGQQIASYPSLAAAQIDSLLNDVQQAQRAWRRLAFDDRARFVSALGDALVHHRETLADLLTLEMGKPISDARAEVDKCVLLCRMAPDMAREALASEVVVDDQDAHVRVEYHALGVVLAVMPWNFPYWQALRSAVPALLAGNGAIVKPAGTVAGGARQLEQTVREAARNAGFDAVPMHVALIDVDDIARVIADDRIAGVTLTGSDRAGRAVGEAAGKHLKKVVLELGGSDPFIVLPSADIAQAATVAASARCVNSGQSCIAAKRFIVVDSVFDSFLEQFRDAMHALSVGDPRSEQTRIGPIATKSVRDSLVRQVDESVRQGARIVIGGSALDLPGFYFEPTILTDISTDSPAAREELFGPVAAVFRARDVRDAIAIANSTHYGLGASVWTTDDAERELCIAELECGMVFVNAMVASHPQYPFGGVKHSGLGRELGIAGCREFTNLKTVRIARNASGQETSARAE